MKKIFSFFVGLLLLLTACGSGKEQTGTTFVGGVKGLSLEFLQDAPPNEVFDGGKFPFTINVQLRNDGEWDVSSKESVQVTILGIQPSDFGKSNADLTKTAPQQLFGMKKDVQGNILQGSVANIDYPGLNYQKPLPGDFTIGLRAKLCYDYGTKAISSLCVRKNLLGLETSVCQINGDKNSDNSGAPVQISSVKEAQAGTDEIRYSFVIKHVGVGTVYEKSSKCSEEVLKKNRVYVKVDTGLSEIAQCDGLQDINGNAKTGNDGYVTLFNNERQISCAQKLSLDRTDFEKPTQVTLEYGYGDGISKSLTIKHI